MKYFKRDLSHVFDRLMEERGEDVAHVINARHEEEERREKADRLMRWYMKSTGSDVHAPALTEDQIDALRENWKDLYDLGIIRPEWYRMYAYKTGRFNPDFIPSDLHYYYVEDEKIDFDYLRGFLDKNYMDVVLPGVKHPPVLVRKIHGMYLDESFGKIDLDKGVSFVDENSTEESIREELNGSDDLHAERVIR